VIAGSYGTKYSAALAVSLAILFAAARWSMRNGSLPVADGLAMLAATLAILGLLPLAPAPRRYIAGVFAMAGAGVAFWFGSPASAWLASVPGAQATSSLGAAFLPLFVAAWLLLASSVAHWLIGILAYLGAGALFLAVFLLAGPIPNPIAAHLAAYLQLAVVLIALWPGWMLTMLGVSGWSFRGWD
jgi:hypothetical protein